MTSLLQTFPPLFFKWQKVFRYFTYIFQSLVEAGNRYEKQEEEERNASFKKMAGKNTRAVSVERD